MALDSGYWESEDNYMNTDRVAALLVKLYGEYVEAHSGGFGDIESKKDEYAEAVGIAVRMLTD